MRLGYNTNGAIGYPLEGILDRLAEVGYQSVAITLDQQSLNPFAADAWSEARRIQRRLTRLGLHSVVETGARNLLNPWTKHHPTLLTSDPAEREFRLAFLHRAIEIAAELESDCVSLWSGVHTRIPEAHESAADDRAHGFSRLQHGLERLLRLAEPHDLPLGFEPEPGMLVATVSDYFALRRELPHPLLRLTLDVGHVHCQREGELAEIIAAAGLDLVNVHLEDMRVDVHEHLPFGTGEIDFPAVAVALRQVGYAGGVHVELSRHSHAFPAIAATSYDFLRNHGF